MSTKIAVMKDGLLQQVDFPERVYHYPANLFVADFIGTPKVNLLQGAIQEKNCVDLGKFRIEMDTRDAHGRVVLAARPEDISLSTTPVPGGVEFTAYSVLPSGADSTIVARREDIEVTVRVMGTSSIRMDDRVWVRFDPASLNLYDKENGNLVACRN